MIKKLFFLMLLVTKFAFSQEKTKTVTGIITDISTGSPLIGVTVLVKSTFKGTISDVEGRYTIDAPSGSVLEFSYIGYTSVEVNADHAGDVQMKTDVQELNEIVVSGLATSVKRSNMANAVGTVSSKKLAGITNQATIDGALYGKIAGVNMTAISGTPGGGFSMRLRGVSSIKGNNQPLIIIDGIYMSNDEIPSGLSTVSGANKPNEEQMSNRIADIDPNDIENIEVLKGASAAAIYGTRANAGVVIITTKKGRAGKTKISLSQNVGFVSAVRLKGLRNWNERNVAETYGQDEVAKFKAAEQLFDYEKTLFGETGKILNTNLSIRGGGEKTTFYLGGSFRDEGGIMKNTGFKRYNIRANIEHRIADKIKISSTTSFIHSETNSNFSGNENNGGLSVTYNLGYTRPWNDLNPDAQGNYPDNPSAAGNMLLVRDIARNDSKINRALVGLGIDATLFENSQHNLRFRWNGGMDHFTDETFVYVPEFHQAQRDKTNGFVGVGKNIFTNLNHQAFLVHDLQLGKVSFNSSLGMTYLSRDRDILMNQATQLVPDQKNLSQSGAKDIIQNKQHVEEFGMVFQEQVNYNDQLIGTFGIRADKSSLNGDPNKLYPFLKGSLAANIHNFDFWKVPFINQLKLRAAYGETGSSPAYGSLYTGFSPGNIGGNRGIVVGVGGAAGSSVLGGQLGVNDLFPETSRELEFGFDLGVLGGLLGLEFTFYNRTVDNLLFSRRLPSSAGFASTIEHDADLKNVGIEIALNMRPVNSKNVVWDYTLNFWRNEATYTHVGVPPFVVTESDPSSGLGLGTFYMEQGGSATGIYQSVNGVAKFMGDTQPDFQMSFYNTFKLFKNVDVSFLLHWKKGGIVLNLTDLIFDDGGTNPEIDSRGQQYADSYIQPGGYLRLREIGIYYKLSLSALEVLGNIFESFRVGVTGRNLFTLTDYRGYDPEVSSTGTNSLGTGLDITPFPSNRQIFFHVDLSF